MVLIMLKKIILTGLFFISSLSIANNTVLSCEETNRIMQYLKDELGWSYDGGNIELRYSSPGSGLGFD